MKFNKKLQKFLIGATVLSVAGAAYGADVTYTNEKAVVSVSGEDHWKKTGGTDFVKLSQINADDNVTLSFSKKDSKEKTIFTTDELLKQTNDGYRINAEGKTEAVFKTPYSDKNPWKIREIIGADKFVLNSGFKYLHYTAVDTTDTTAKTAETENLIKVLKATKTSGKNFGADDVIVLDGGVTLNNTDDGLGKALAGVQAKKLAFTKGVVIIEKDAPALDIMYHGTTESDKGREDRKVANKKVIETFVKADLSTSEKKKAAYDSLSTQLKKSEFEAILSADGYQGKIKGAELVSVITVESDKDKTINLKDIDSHILSAVSYQDTDPTKTAYQVKEITVDKSKLQHVLSHSNMTLKNVEVTDGNVVLLEGANLTLEGANLTLEGTEESKKDGNGKQVTSHVSPKIIKSEVSANDITFKKHVDLGDSTFNAKGKIAADGATFNIKSGMTTLNAKTSGYNNVTFDCTQGQLTLKSSEKTTLKGNVVFKFGATPGKPAVTLAGKFNVKALTGDVGKRFVLAGGEKGLKEKNNGKFVNEGQEFVFFEKGDGFAVVETEGTENMLFGEAEKDITLADGSVIRLLKAAKDDEKMLLKYKIVKLVEEKTAEKKKASNFEVGKLPEKTDSIEAKEIYANSKTTLDNIKGKDGKALEGEAAEVVKLIQGLSSKTDNKASLAVASLVNKNIVGDTSEAKVESAKAIKNEILGSVPAGLVTQTALKSSAQEVTNAVSSRMTAMTAAGMSSGEGDEVKFGVYGHGFMNNAENNVGFKSTSSTKGFGGGAEMSYGDNVAVGAIYTCAFSEVKVADAKKDDKATTTPATTTSTETATPTTPTTPATTTAVAQSYIKGFDVTSHTVGGYGHFESDMGLFGQLFGGYTWIKGEYAKDTKKLGQEVKAEIKGSGMVGYAHVGYVMKTNDGLAASLYGGAEGSMLTIDAYTETGNAVNIGFDKQELKPWAPYLGARFAYTVDMDGSSITPFVDVRGYYNAWNGAEAKKAEEFGVKLEGASDFVKVSHTHGEKKNFSLNPKAGLAFKASMFELQASIEGSFLGDRTSMGGSLKVKVSY